MAGALSGLKILDFSTLLPGPLATMHLADMGAEVLRVTSGTRADLVQTMPPYVPGMNISATAAQIGRNKKVITLNLKDSRAVQIIKELIREYDIVLEQYRPGVMKKLGLDYETLSAINPGIIYCSLTGYGQDGPMAVKAGHDINYLSLSGMMSYAGRKKDGPSLMGIQIADIASGTNNTIISILAAVIYRNNTGRGQYLDVSMTDGVFALNAMSGPGVLATGENPKREGELLNGGSLYDFYETKDGEYVSFGGLEPKFFADFCRVIHREEWIEKGVQAGDEIKNEVREIMKTKTRDEWMSIFREADACFEPVLSLSEALNGELARERNMVVDVPAAEGKTIRQIGSPFKFSESPVEYKFAGRTLEQADTEEVLMALGYSMEEIESLAREGVLQ